MFAALADPLSVADIVGFLAHRNQGQNEVDASPLVYDPLDLKDAGNIKQIASALMA